MSLRPLRVMRVNFSPYKKQRANLRQRLYTAPFTSTVCTRVSFRIAVSSPAIVHDTDDDDVYVSRSQVGKLSFTFGRGTTDNSARSTRPPGVNPAPHDRQGTYCQIGELTPRVIDSLPPARIASQSQQRQRDIFRKSSVLASRPRRSAHSQSPHSSYQRAHAGCARYGIDS